MTYEDGLPDTGNRANRRAQVKSCIFRGMRGGRLQIANGHEGGEGREYGSQTRYHCTILPAAIYDL